MPELRGVEVLGKKSRKALEQNMGPGEAVEFCIAGNSDQAIVALSDRVLVIKPGHMAGASFGVKVTSFNYSDIRGIEIKTGFYSWIEIASAGFETTGQKKNGYEMPNCLPFRKHDLPIYQTRLDRLRTKFTEAKTVGNEPDNLVAQLTQLGHLRDAGVLT
jgi:hypothetical protein